MFVNYEISISSLFIIDTSSDPKKQCGLTCDQHLQRITLQNIGWQYEQIANYLNIRFYEVQYTFTIGQVTP